MIRFSFKTFTSFLLVLTFLALTLSGTMLFVSPPGRVAHWTNWTLLGLGKEEWGALHILMAVVFLIGGLFHLLKFNWKIFFHYLKKKRHGAQYRKELLASIVLFGIVLTGTLAQIPPFTAVIALHEGAKAYWEEESGNPPVPHMELMKLSEVAAAAAMSTREAKDILTRHGLELDSADQTLQSIAAAGDLSPQAVYDLLQPSDQTYEGTAGMAGTPPLGRGLGRRTLAEVAGQLEVPIEEILQTLKSQGIETERDERLREIAERSAMNPHELIEMLREAHSK